MRSHTSWAMATWMIPWRHFLRESLHLVGAEEEAVRGHRAGVTADLAPAEARAKKDEGGGQRLEAGKLGHESLSAVQLFLEFAKAEVREGPKAAPTGLKAFSKPMVRRHRLSSLSTFGAND